MLVDAIIKRNQSKNFILVCLCKAFETINLNDLKAHALTHPFSFEAETPDLSVSNQHADVVYLVDEAGMLECTYIVSGTINKYTIPYTADLVETPTMKTYSMQIHITLNRIICTKCQCFLNSHPTTLLLTEHFKRHGHTELNEASKMANLLMVHLIDDFPEVCDFITRERQFEIPGLTDNDKKAVVGIPIFRDGVRCLVEDCGKVMKASNVVRKHVAKHLERPSVGNLLPDTITEAVLSTTQEGIMYQQPFSSSIKKGYKNTIYEVDPTLHEQEVRKVNE